MRLPCAAAAALVFALGAACGEPPATHPVQAREHGAQWQDVLEGTPDIYVVIRPRAFKQDPVYKWFWTALVRVAQARHYVSGASMLEALEGSEEIILGLQKDDAVLVARGVPASLSPERLVDAEGHPWLRVVDERTKVLEYEVVEPRLAKQGALFTLPDRTWVAALGPARSRARQAFATPLNRPVPEVPAEALAVVRLAAPVARLLVARDLMIGDLLEGATHVSFTLASGKAGLRIAIAYDDPARVAKAEMQAKRVLEAWQEKRKDFEFLKIAYVAYEGNAVVIRVNVPPRLLEELPRTTGADL